MQTFHVCQVFVDSVEMSVSRPACHTTHFQDKISRILLTTYPDSGVTVYVTVRTLPSGNKTEYCPDT